MMVRTSPIIAMSVRPTVLTAVSAIPRFKTTKGTNPESLSLLEPLVSRSRLRLEINKNNWKVTSVFFLPNYCWEFWHLQ